MSFNSFEIFYISKSRTLGNCDYVTDILKEGDPKRLLLMYKQQVGDLKKIKDCMKHTLKSHKKEIERLQYNIDIVDSKLRSHNHDAN